MKTRVEILSVEEKSGVSTKSGTPTPWNIRKAHCVLFLEGGKEVGTIQIPRDMEKSPAPGMYDAEFGIRVDFKTREVGGALIALNPVSDGGFLPPADVPVTPAKKGA